MFRRGAQRSTSYYVLNNVVWGTSLGGIVLLAEEKRRQVLVAQKLLDNRLKLQSLMSYYTLASIDRAEFGRSSDTDNSTSHNPSQLSTPFSDLDSSLGTQNEGKRRKRRRKRRRIAADSPESDRLAIDAPKTLPSRSNRSSSSSHHIFGHQDRLRRSFVEPRQVSRPPFNLNLGNGSVPVWSARRHTATLAATQPNDGYSYEDGWDYSNDHEFSSRTVQPVEAYRTDLAIDSESFARRMHRSLQAGDLNNAFYEFIKLCDHATQPITGYVRNAIRQLVEAYKSIGKFSVVLEVQQKLLLVLREWTMLTEDFPWLLEQATQEKLRISQICSRTIQPLVRIGQPDHAVELCCVALRTAMSWCQRGKASWEEVNSVSNVLTAIKVGSLSDRVQRLVSDAYQQAYDTQLPDIARSLLQWMRDHGVAPTIAEQRIEQMISINEQKNEDIQRYVSSLKSHKTPEKIFDATRYLDHFESAVTMDQYVQSNILLTTIMDLSLPLDNQHLERILSVLAAQLDLRTTSGISQDQTQALLPLFRSVSNLILRGRYQNAAATVLNLSALSGQPDPTCFDNYLEICSVRGNYQKILETIKEFPSLNLSKRCLDHVVHACCSTKQTDFIAKLLRTRVNVNILSENALVELSKANDNTVSPQATVLLARSYRNRQAYADLLLLLGSSTSLENLGPELVAIKYQALAMTGTPANTLELLRSLSRTKVALDNKALKRSHASLLRRCWKQTRNFHFTRKVFSAIQELQSSSSPTVDIYNAMIQASVEADQLAVAQDVANEMIKIQQLDPTAETMGYLMLARAKEKNWTEVDRLLKRALDAGLISNKTSADREFFNSTFFEFSRQHSAEDTFNFAVKLVTDFELQPTSNMSRRVVHGLVKDERADLLSQWVRLSQQDVADLALGQYSSNLLLRRIAWSKKEVGPSKTTSAAIEELSATRSKSRAATQKPRERTRTIERDMINAMSKNKPSEAVDIYSAAFDQGSIPGQTALSLAVDASLRANPNSTKQTAGLLNEAKAAKLFTKDTRTSLLIHGIRERDISDGEARSIVVEYYQRLDALKTPIHHHVTMAVARSLMMRERYILALSIMRGAEASEWGQRKAFDIANQTLCLRLHAQLGDIEGVERVVGQVLSKNLRIDKTFVATLKSCRQLPKRGLQRGWRNMDKTRCKRMIEVLDSSIHKCLERRKKQRETSFAFAKEAVDLLSGNEEIPPV